MKGERNKIIREVARAARMDPEVLALVLYGSAARRENSVGSDIDLCLILTLGDHSPLALSRKKLECAAKFSSHVTIFQQLPLYIRQRVLRDGRVLYCRDPDMLYEVAFVTIREFGDFEHIYLDYLKEVANAG